MPACVARPCMRVYACRACACAFACVCVFCNVSFAGHLVLEVCALQSLAKRISFKHILHALAKSCLCCKYVRGHDRICSRFCVFALCFDGVFVHPVWRCGYVGQVCLVSSGRTCHGHNCQSVCVCVCVCLSVRLCIYICIRSTCLHTHIYRRPYPFIIIVCAYTHHRAGSNEWLHKITANYHISTEPRVYRWNLHILWHVVLCFFLQFMFNDRAQ